MQVLDQGEVTLVDSMGDDLSVVRAARVSNGAAMEEWRDVKDEKLIKFLAKHKHMTPFEHVTFTFHVKLPIFVAREWQRHRTFSYNEMSARYKELPLEFYYPLTARIPDPDNKQSSMKTLNPTITSTMDHSLSRAYIVAGTVYKDMIAAGISRELARLVLPVGIYTEMYVTGNLRNWAHFYKLRAGAEAQLEIQAYAIKAGDMIEKVAPISWKALVEAEDG